MRHKFISVFLILLLLCGCAGKQNMTQTEVTYAPITESIPAEDPEPLPRWSEEEVTALAQMLYGEARGIASDTEKAACVWCVLNRCDAYNASIIEVVSAPKQFVGYFPDHPVDADLKVLCEDVLTRYFAEKDGETDVGRILPADYLYFSGDGEHNYFRNAFCGGQTWDWSLPSPYES